MSLSKLGAILFGMTVLLFQANAAVPEWVNEHVSSPALGIRSIKHEIISNWLQISLQATEKRSLHHYRIVIRVGGQGNFGDITYPIHHTGGEHLNVMGAWQVFTTGHIGAVPGKALTRSNTFGDYALYSDDFVSSWVLNNVEVGSLLAIEYQLETDYLQDYGLMYLQDDNWRIDTTFVQFVMPKSSVLKIIPFKSDGQTVVVTGNTVAAGSLTEWKDASLSGGYRVGAARFEYSLFTSGSPDIPPRTWKDVSTNETARWRKVKTSIDLPYAPVAPSIDSISEFVRQFERDFRYVAIEIGEGRFVPHKPEQVLKMKYGDCKDLSFFLATYLSAHGVTTFPVLVNVPAEDPFSDTFPYAYQFNHCIVAILQASDTFYYDPTSHGYPLGVLPWNDQGAPALWLTEGSDLIRLPLDTVPYLQERRIEGSLDARGHFEGTVSITLDPRASRGESTNQVEETLKKTVRSILREDLTAEITEVARSDSGRTVSAHLVCRNYARNVSGALYWKPYPFIANVTDSVQANSPQGYYVGRRTRKRDSIRIALPKETLPPDSLDIRNALSAGYVSVNLKADSALVRAEWISENYSSHYPPSSKAALDSFLSSLDAARNYRLKLIPR